MAMGAPLSLQPSSNTRAISLDSIGLHWSISMGTCSIAQVSPKTTIATNAMERAKPAARRRPDFGTAGVGGQEQERVNVGVMAVLFRLRCFNVPMPAAMTLHRIRRRARGRD